MKSYISCNVFLLAENHLVHIKLSTEGLGILGNQRLIPFKPGESAYSSEILYFKPRCGQKSLTLS